MRNTVQFVQWIFPLLFCVTPALSQDHIPVIKNIFKTIDTDTSKSLWTFKKTDLLRINVVKMQGEAKLHKHPDAEHTILLIQGEMLAEVNGKKFWLREGDMISIPIGVPHKYTVKGRRAIIISMDAPYYDPAKTIILE
ncbi:MAG: cupin domain-containing protein [Bacteroidetes bacterium]|nr:cupin domain-containing protein [Bacteroidota bacterium]